jgi:hypothetical protein
MRTRILSLVSLSLGCALVLVAGAAPAWAGDGYGQDNSAGAQASGGVITVQAGATTWTPPKGSKWANAAQPDPPPGKPNPNQPYGCTYTPGGPSATATIGVGGPQPGQWVFPMCAGPGVIDPMPPFWVTGAQTAAIAVQVSPVVVAHQALRRLGLSSPAIRMAPPAGRPQLVGVATWLWIDPAAWRTLSASATAGPVTTTAVATPTRVVWNMGDGSTVTCDGPGTPYDPSTPNATTDCSYTWPASGSFQVTATVYWSVSWTAQGAPGGGTLGVQAGPASAVTVVVEESQAINTGSGGGD